MRESEDLTNGLYFVEFEQVVEILVERLFCLARNLDNNVKLIIDLVTVLSFLLAEIFIQQLCDLGY